MSSKETEDSPVLRGEYVGESRGRKRLTAWKDTVMTTLPNSQNPESLPVVGSGVSEWRGIDVHFNISGQLNPKTRELTLTKTHVGRFTNSITYKCTVAADGTIEGKYLNGTISLRRERSIVPVPVEDLNGAWIGSSKSSVTETSWNETELRFTAGEGGVVTIAGGGRTSWRGETITFSISGSLNPETYQCTIQKSYSGQYSHSVDYTGTILPKMDLHRGRVATVEGVYGTNGRLSLLLRRAPSTAA